MEKVVFLKTSHSTCPRGSFCTEELLHDSAVSVGVFDGLHLGHRHLIERLKLIAKQKGLKTLLLSFYPHPVRVLSPSQAPCELTNPYERSLLAKELGVDLMVFVRFDRRFSTMSAEEFLQEVIHRRLKAKHLVVGYDWRFGYRREGEIELAKEMGQRLGFEVEEVEPFRTNGHIVSSTLIRRLLHMGRLDEAKLYLGRSYAIRRRVVRGEGRGSKLGFPTANLLGTENLCLKEGVYAVRVDNRFLGVANFGYRPTFDGKRKVLEVHILDFEGDLRGKEVSVEFLEFLRPERKFSDPKELVKQIEEDIQRVKTYSLR